MTRRIILILAFVALLLVPLAIAQEIGNGLIDPISAADVNPNANISFPPPVYVVRGDSVEIRGTVNLPNMRNYFVEFRPLIVEESSEITATPIANRPWFPATLTQTLPVNDNLIGTWNTFTAPDGLYELRLTINTTDAQPVFARISPIRVQNNIPSFLEGVDTSLPTPLPTQIAPSNRPTLVPTPTSVTGVGGAPVVTALVDSNVRRGDSTIYDRVGFLFVGETAQVVGVSSFSSGWYYIELKDGKRGFVAPSVVDLEGSIAGVPLINPPPPPTPVATATPIPTSTPITSANVKITNVRLDPNPPTCKKTYTIYVKVQNDGTTATNTGGSISITDTRAADGTLIESTFGAFPILQPGQTFEGIIPITVDTYYEENHNINFVIDSTGVIPETNENDNALTVSYNLKRGDC